MRAPGGRAGPRPGRHRGGASSGIRTQARRGGVSPAPAAGPPQSTSSGSRRSGGEEPGCARVCAAVRRPIAGAMAAATRRMFHLQPCGGCLSRQARRGRGGRAVRSPQRRGARRGRGAVGAPGRTRLPSACRDPRPRWARGSWKLPRPGVRCEFGGEGGEGRGSTRVVAGGPGSLVDTACSI